MSQSLGDILCPCRPPERVRWRFGLRCCARFTLLASLSRTLDWYFHTAEAFVLCCSSQCKTSWPALCQRWHCSSLLEGKCQFGTNRLLLSKWLYEGLLSFCSNFYWESWKVPCYLGWTTVITMQEWNSWAEVDRNNFVFLRQFDLRLVLLYGFVLRK